MLPVLRLPGVEYAEAGDRPARSRARRHRRVHVARPRFQVRTNPLPIAVPGDQPVDELPLEGPGHVAPLPVPAPDLRSEAGELGGGLEFPIEPLLAGELVGSKPEGLLPVRVVAPAPAVAPGDVLPVVRRLPIRSVEPAVEGPRLRVLVAPVDPV